MSKRERMMSVGQTHPGLVRDRNEDSFFADAPNCFWVVADGMGGHSGGDQASEAITQLMRITQLPSAFVPSSHTLSDAIYSANQAIWERSQELGEQMGSTIVTLYVREGRYAIMWVGDSRAYLLRRGELARLSRDHSQVQAMVDAGTLSEEEAEEHPMAHVLSRALGVAPQVDIDATAGSVRPGDVFLLCSDGLTGLVSDAEISDIVNSTTIDDAVEELLELVMERGAPDNVTIVLAEVAAATRLELDDDGVQDAPDTIQGDDPAGDQAGALS
ncbi:MAG: protein phosphatase 2C domain-containing protein [Pseudomonadota bacterium]